MHRKIRRIALSNRHLSLRKVAWTCNNDTGASVSMSTVDRILNKYGLKCHTASNKPLLTAKQRRKRIKWARDKKCWTDDKWASVVFSDESMFRSLSHSGQRTVRRFSHEPFIPACTNKVVQHSPQVLVWGCFSRNGVGLLKRIDSTLNAKRYQKEIIHDIDTIGKCLVFPKRNFIFMQDLAPCHRAMSTKVFLDRLDVNVIDWPGNSPDLNPIENLWYIIKRQLPCGSTLTSDELWESIQDIWYKTPSYLCRRLFDSIPRRIAAVLQSKGYPTKY